MNYVPWLSLLCVLGCKARGSLADQNTSAAASVLSFPTNCVEPKPVVLFMPGCGFGSCGVKEGKAWLIELMETLNGIIPASHILLVEYTASPYPNTGGFAMAVKTAMQNPCVSKVITAGASAGDTIGSHLATHFNDFGLPRPVDAHIGLYGPKQFLYYRDHPELQGVPNEAGPAVPAMRNLEAYAGSKVNAKLFMASPQTYASVNSHTRVFTSMGTLDRRINKDTAKLFFEALGGSRDGFNVLHTCETGAHGYHFNGMRGTNPVDVGGSGFGGGSCFDMRKKVREFVCSVIELTPCP